MVLENGNRDSMNVPREWAPVHRLEWGLHAVLAR
jgi:hypothetical protein